METDMQGLLLELPSGYYLEREPDLLVLRRLDGAMVGAFSARGVAPDALQRTFEETLQQESLQWEPSADHNETSGSPAAQPSLQVRFFGHFELLRNGEVLPLRRNGKALTILKYLLAHRSRPVSQDHLMGWLWPHSNLKKARWSLNSAIHTLRKLLNECPAASSGSPNNFVILEEGYYRLCSEVQVVSDVDDFDECYEEGRRLHKEGSLEGAASHYERAISLYRGEYLVEDLYEDWTMVERERLSNAYIEMLGRLALYYYQTDQDQESIRACYRILEKDRCHEESYRMLMRSYWRIGLRGRALRQYRLCERILSQEYGSVPSAETQALYRSLLTEQN
jgi:LuxR family transcriptional regulator, maltose regulon positive regulatory protein